MSNKKKTSPSAVIYHKWLTGIRETVPDEAEQGRLLNYIADYQFSKIYGIEHLPNKDRLSPISKAIVAMLDGDMTEFCAKRKTKINNPSKKSDEYQEETEENESSQEETEENEGKRNKTDSPSKQNKTNQNNINQNKPNIAREVSRTLGVKVEEFELGLGLLRKGYIVKAIALRGVYANASVAKNPIAYAATAFSKNECEECGQPCANFVEATGVKDTRALEVYGVKVQDGIMYVRCTQDAAQVIGTHGIETAQRYATQCGAKEIRLLYNGNG